MTSDGVETRSFTDPLPGESDRGWLLRWFNVHPRPTFIVARDLRVVAMNINATKLTHGESMLTVRSGQLVGLTRQMHTLLAAAVTEATFAEPVRRIFDTGETVFVIRASVVEDAPDALVSLSLRDTSRRPTCAPLKEVFGVTNAEQKVIEQLLLGLTVEAASEALGISILTVRTQTKHAYAKLGVSNREELFAKLLPFLEIGSS